jgi:hypothetical protein
MGSIPVDACAVCILFKKCQRMEFHAALKLSEFGRCGAFSASTRHDRFDLDSLFALQYAVGQMAGVSIKDLASEAKSSSGCGLGHVWVTFATGCY